MEKNKLGIVINTTKANNRTSGFRSIYRFNDDKWSSVIRDTGAELKKVTNNSTSAPIHFIQFESNGCCYCIMQSIAGRKDYQSAWIFIHKDILLPKGELSSIIQKVEEVLSLDVEDKKSELDYLFGKPYTTTDSPSYPTSTGELYAVRYYGNGTDLMYTRQQVLEENLYQSAYCRYKSVFLVDKGSGQIVSGVDDLTNTKLEKSFVIDLPAECCGFKHDWGTDSLRVTEGSSVSVTWTRPDYKPVRKNGKCREELLVQKTDMKRSFRLNMFKIVDKVTGNELKATIRFSVWFDDDSHGCIYFREEDLTKVPYTVELETYVAAKGSLDLTKPNAKGMFVIELQPEQHVYNCYINTNIPDAPRIEFVINTQHKLKGTEIPGLKFEGGPSETTINRLVVSRKQQTSPPIGIDAVSIRHKGYANANPIPTKGHNGKGTPWWQFLLVVAILLLVLVVGYMGYQYVFPSDVPYNTEVIDNEDCDTVNDWDQAVDYLRQNNTTWIETDMEKFPKLKGVYAMIRDFQFKKLKDFIDSHPDLKDINEWSRLYRIAVKNNDKKGMWSQDGSINVEKYLNTDFESKEDAKPNESFSDIQNDAIDDNSNSSSSSAGSNHREKDRSNEKRKDKGKSNSNGKDGSGDKSNSNSKESSKGNNNQDNLN